MDGPMRSQATGGGVFLLCGVIVLIVGAPELLGLLLIVVGVLMLALALGGHATPADFLRARRSGRRGGRRR